MSIHSILNMAKEAMMVEQKAIDVTAHNIANVNTEGYSRQRPVMVNRKGIHIYGGIMGRGVDLVAIQRKYDQFMLYQINEETSLWSRWQWDNSVLREVETVLTEDEEFGFNKSLNEFWNAWADLANQPTGYTERSSLVAAAQRLSQVFKTRRAGLYSIQENLDANIQAAVDEVNNITSSIADLNQQIFTAEVSGHKANDLRDQRDELLRNLSEYLDYTSLTDQDGKVTVLLKNGNPLVSGIQSWDLKADSLMENSRFHQVEWENREGSRSSVMEVIGQGKLKALIEQRDSFVEGVIQDLDRLAAKITQEVNRIHAQGYGLDGSSGNMFFEPLQAQVWQSTDNLGQAVAEATVYDQSLLDLHEYQVIFTDATHFTVRDLNTGQDVVVDHDYLADGPAYFNGIKFVISDGPGGGPSAGDTFYISTTARAAENFSVSSQVLNDLDKIAASQSGDPGDNQIALDIGALQSQKIMLDQSATFDEYLGKVVSEVGARKQNAELNELHHQATLDHLKTMRDMVSGVSVDEEMVNLIKYQRAFQASAKLITVMDELYEAVISSLRR